MSPKEFHCEPFYVLLMLESDDVLCVPKAHSIALAEMPTRNKIPILYIAIRQPRLAQKSAK
jgi:hypothetical protein